MDSIYDYPYHESINYFPQILGTDKDELMELRDDLEADWAYFAKRNMPEAETYQNAIFTVEAQIAVNGGNKCDRCGATVMETRESGPIDDSQDLCLICADDMGV